MSGLSQTSGRLQHFFWPPQIQNMSGTEYKGSQSLRETDSLLKHVQYSGCVGQDVHTLWKFWLVWNYNSHVASASKIAHALGKVVFRRSQGCRFLCKKKNNNGWSYWSRLRCLFTKKEMWKIKKNSDVLKMRKFKGGKYNKGSHLLWSAASSRPNHPALVARGF